MSESSLANIDRAAQIQARLTGILDASLDCIIAIDRAGVITDFNAAAEQTFGYSRADAIGREMAELIVPPALRDRHRAGLRRLVETGEGAGMVGRRIEVNALRADGSELAVELTITRIVSSSDVFFVAYLRADATARLQTRFTGILDAALDCIITIDHEGRITDFNSAAERTFGYTRAQAVGCEMAQLIVPPALRERHRSGLRRLVETGHGAGLIGKRIEVPALRADGTEIPVELAITQISSGGAQPFYTAYLRDISERKRTEATLAANAAQQREARDYFEKSFSSSPALMSIVRASDGRIIAANSTFLRGSGFTLDELLNHTTEELGLWTQPEARAEFLRSISAAGNIRDFEADFTGKLGGVRTLLLNADIIEIGGAPCILTVGIDVTERRRRDLVQAATYEISHAQLEGDDVPGLFAKVHRIIGRLMPTKNFYVALLNEDRSLLSFPYFVDETVAHPAPRPPRNSITEMVLDTCEPLLATFDEIVARLRARGPFDPPPGNVPCAQWMGAPLMVEGRSIGVIALQDYHNPRAYSEDDKRLLVFVADQTAAATHRQETEAARRRAEQQYRSIFENALEGLYQTSLEGRFLQANPAIVRMLGYPSVGALLQIQWQKIYVQAASRRDDFFRLIQQSDEITDFESEVYRYDGSKLWISESVRVLRNSAGEIDHFEAVAVNITAQREAARALQHAKEEADAASRAKSTFLASMSHELRTPLNGILGYAQILRRDEQLSTKQREAVAVIHSSADHLLSLINDVLDLSKIEARKLELHAADFDLAEFAQGVMHVFVPRAQEKNLVLETSFAPDLPRMVRGDEQRLRQVVFNLLGNAIKFTTRGGVVFSIDRSGDLVRVSVSDSGPGIAPEDQVHLFEPFTQVGDKRQRSGGTGLGLAISRSIVEQMGGKLQHESRPGAGSRFWFELPLPAVEGVLPVAPTSAQVTGYHGPRRRVLVADDHPANRSLLVDLLTPLGFQVVTANDGAEAITLAIDPERSPDIILLDLRMPRVDGLSAARAIQESFAARRVRCPVIVGVSASAFNIDRQTFLDGGCADFLAKPFREEQLLGLIAHHLGLAWIHAGTPSGETQFITRSSMPSSGPIQSPPAADLDELFRLASNGDVLGVRLFAEGMPERNAQLAPFAKQVVDLAARYKMKAIRQLIARHRG